MRTILTILCSLVSLACSAQIPQEVMQWTLLKATNVVSSGCSTPSYATFNEGFEGTGYENTWATATGTVDPDYATPTGFPNGCSQCLRVVTDGNDLHANYDMGASKANLGISFYFRAHAMGAAWNRTSVLDFYGSAYFNAAFGVIYRNAGGTPVLYLSGTADSANWTLSLDTWYYVQIHGAMNGGTVYMKIDNANEKSVTAAAQTPRYVTFGTGVYYHSGFDFAVDDVHMNYTDAYVSAP